MKVVLDIVKGLDYQELKKPIIFFTVAFVVGMTLYLFRSERVENTPAPVLVQSPALPCTQVQQMSPPHFFVEKALDSVQWAKGCLLFHADISKSVNEIESTALEFWQPNPDLLGAWTLGKFIVTPKQVSGYTVQSAILKNHVLEMRYDPNTGWYNAGIVILSIIFLIAGWLILTLIIAQIKASLRPREYA